MVYMCLLLSCSAIEMDFRCVVRWSANYGWMVLQKMDPIAPTSEHSSVGKSWWKIKITTPSCAHALSKHLDIVTFANECCFDMLSVRKGVLAQIHGWRTVHAFMYCRGSLNSWNTNHFVFWHDNAAHSVNSFVCTLTAGCTRTHVCGVRLGCCIGDVAGVG